MAYEEGGSKGKKKRLTNERMAEKAHVCDIGDDIEHGYQAHRGG